MWVLLYLFLDFSWDLEKQNYTKDTWSTSRATESFILFGVIRRVSFPELDFRHGSLLENACPRVHGRVCGCVCLCVSASGLNSSPSGQSLDRSRLSWSLCKFSGDCDFHREELRIPHKRGGLECQVLLRTPRASSLLYHHGETGGTAVFLVYIGGEVRGRRARFLRMISGVSKVLDMASSVVCCHGSRGLRVFFVRLPRSPRCELLPCRLFGLFAPRCCRSSPKIACTGRAFDFVFGGGGGTGLVKGGGCGAKRHHPGWAVGGGRETRPTILQQHTFARRVGVFHDFVCLSFEWYVISFSCGRQAGTKRA